jgi:AraC-like DNA-binding protein
MEEKKPWLNGELTAGQLSQLLGISVNHLSQVLNKEQHQNFFDFINSYRVSEVIRRMGDNGNSHLTLLAIALDSGFNSKTSFNTVFKKVTNQTPSHYCKALHAKASLKNL